MPTTYWLGYLKMQYAEIDYCQDNQQSYYVVADSEIDTIYFSVSLIYCQRQ